jgi:REP element-mobilizing transposase RayT
MPVFQDRRYNSLRLLGHDYGSTSSLYALSLVTDQRRPAFADVRLAKATLQSLLSDQTLSALNLRAFCLMPDHLHLLTGVKDPKVDLSTLIGRFESYTTQLYWKRSREILETREVALPSSEVNKKGLLENRDLIAALMDWRATLRPEKWFNLRIGQTLNPNNF